MKTSLTLAFVFIFSIHSLAQNWQDTTKLIGEIFSRYQPGHPGCQLAISRHGKIIYSRAWGLSDLEHSTPLSTSSIIEAGSVSKQFTAAAILLLQSAGKLSLNDDVRKYLPELPDYGKIITLKDMIHHTSGLKDWGSLMAFSDWPRGTKIYSNEDVLRIIIRQKSLNHNPGEEFLYSNTNYVLLAIIVQRVSGQSLAEFTSLKIFRPLQMNSTQWRNDIRRVVPGRAIAYSKEGDLYFTDMPYENVYGNGGLLTTAEDLLKWNDYYTHANLDGPGFLKEQLDTIPLNNGQPNNYAAGLRLVNIKGFNAIVHDGATAAYRSILEYYPELDLGIAWLANTSEFDGKDDGLDALRSLLLGEKTPAKENKVAVISKGKSSGSEMPAKNIVLNKEALQVYEGNYRSSEVESSLEIVLTGTTLKIKRIKGDIFTLQPVSDQEFKIENSRIKVVFEKNADGKVLQLKFSSPKVRNVCFEKT